MNEQTHLRRKRPRKPLTEEGKPGRHDPRNTLNDLTGKEWLLLSKSYWETEPSTLDKSAYGHPAPFMVKDIQKLISLFTKKGMTVLDPFAGSGTTILAALLLDRKAIGIDLNPAYRLLANTRLSEFGLSNYEFLVGDAKDCIKKVGLVDYIVTSPPYYNILRHNGKGLRNFSGKSFRMSAREGVKSYGDLASDLGNCESYEEFLGALKIIMKSGYRVLRSGKYCTVVISDFTVNKSERCVTADIVLLMRDVGYNFCGSTVLLQPVKPLFPFGYPYAYKINHHHQSLLTFQKPKIMAGEVK